MVNNPKHQKAKLLKLTENGKNAYEKAMQKQIPWVNSLASEFEDNDLKVVSSVLQKLVYQLGASDIQS